MSAPKYTCSKCNAIKEPGTPCRPCEAQYQRQYNANKRVSTRAPRVIRAVFKRLKEIKTTHLIEIFDVLSGDLLHSGLYANAQECYDALLLRRGHSPMSVADIDIDSWIDDSSVYVKTVSI